MINQLLYCIARNYVSIDSAAYFLGNMLKKELVFNFDKGKNRIIEINVVHDYGNRFIGEANVLYFETNKVSRVNFKIDANKYGIASGPYDIEVLGDVGNYSSFSNYNIKSLYKLAKKNDPNAMYQLGINSLDLNHPESAFQWFLKAAKYGHLEAQFNVGASYDKGEGVTKNEVEAFKWYKRAAEQGHIEAQRNVGICYYRGEGVAQDEVEAFRWFKKAAEQGHASSQYNLGSCYDKGEGVAKNEVEAFKWYKRAAEQGHEAAIEELELFDEE